MEDIREVAHQEVNYTLISYHNTDIDCWTTPSAIQGVGEEVERMFVVQTKRALVLRQVPPQNIGLEACVIGYFNDATGEIKTLDKPKLLVVLENPSEVSPIKS